MGCHFLLQRIISRKALNGFWLLLHCKLPQKTVSRHDGLKKKKNSISIVHIFLLSKLRFRSLHHVLAVMIQRGLRIQWTNPVAPVPYGGSMALSPVVFTGGGWDARQKQYSVHALPCLLLLAPNSTTAAHPGFHLLLISLCGEATGITDSPIWSRAPQKGGPQNPCLLSNWNGL